MFTSGLATVLTPFSISAFHSASPFGKNCEFEELKNVHHGFLVEVITEQQGSSFFFRSQGDRSVEAVAVTSRVTMKRATDFFQKFVSFPVFTQTFNSSISAALPWRARPTHPGRA